MEVCAWDRHLELSEAQRREGLQRVANNTSFLILPWVRVAGLASHVLGQIARRIDADWQAKYGHRLKWLETFVNEVGSREGVTGRRTGSA